MARTTVRVNIPNTNADEVIKLIEAIIGQHNALNAAAAGSSPIAQKTMDALNAILIKAKPDRAAAKVAQAQADTLFSNSNTALGLGEGQTMRSEGTGLWLVGQIRDLLLANYRGQEINLENFGFAVSVGTAAIPQRPVKAATGQITGFSGALLISSPVESGNMRPCGGPMAGKVL